VLAVGFLLLDAALIGAVALRDHQPWLLVWSLVFAALAVGVLVLRRRYVRVLDEVREARERLKHELRAVRQPGPAGEDVR